MQPDPGGCLQYIIASTVQHTFGISASHGHMLTIKHSYLPQCACHVCYTHPLYEMSFTQGRIRVTGLATFDGRVCCITFQYGNVNNVGRRFTPLHNIGSPSTNSLPPNLSYSARMKAQRMWLLASMAAGAGRCSSVRKTFVSNRNGCWGGNHLRWLPPYTTFDRCSE